MPRIAQQLVLVLLLCAAAPAIAGDDQPLQRLATCKDSWLEWKDDAVRGNAFVSMIQSRFKPTDGAGATPRAPMTVFGFPVVQVFPQSIGMAVGFSVLVQGHSDAVRQVYEKQLGHALACTTSDGMKACELKIADKKSATLMTEDDGRAATTLIGCYYFYEK